MFLLEFGVVGFALLIIIQQLGVILRQLLEVTTRNDVTVVGDHLVQTLCCRTFITPCNSEHVCLYEHT